MSLLTTVLVLHVIVALPVCVHILLTKRETSAPSWIALVLISPFVGAALYWILGINRVERRARRFRAGRQQRHVPHIQVPQIKEAVAPFADLPTRQQQQIFQYETAVHEAPFLGGNTVLPLIGAAEVFPDMLKAIAEAKKTIALSVYIFDRDEVGRQFVDALKEAHARGVAVAVLVDEIGSGDKDDAADRELAKAGIPTARFIPQKIKFLPVVNLRNHRKIMIVDGEVGYIGGMNICLNYGRDEGRARQPKGSRPMGSRRKGAGDKGSDGKPVTMSGNNAVRDMHYRVTGPVLEQMNQVFEEDWLFASGKPIKLPVPTADPARLNQPQYVRIIPDGPDNPFQRTLWIMLGALSFAQKSVHILTPYFLPNMVLTSALSVAALRGIDVRVVIPAATDIKLVDWAMQAKFQELLEHGVKLYAGGEPFDHSKLMVVDGVWFLVGSSNWDQRSLRLNFEANLECYDAEVAEQLDAHFHAMQQQADLISLKKVQATPVHIRLRNNIARLFTPYL